MLPLQAVVLESMLLSGFSFDKKFDILLIQNRRISVMQCIPTTYILGMLTFSEQKWKVLQKVVVVAI